VNDSGLRTGELGVFDKLFNNEMNILVSQTKSFYEDTSFKLALKAGFYDFVSKILTHLQLLITDRAIRSPLETGTETLRRRSAFPCTKIS
jgi:hypothetical protein